METKAFDEGTCIAQLMGFTKDELRDLSAAMGLPVAAFWSKDRICRAMVQAMGENPASTADWFSHPLLKELRDLSEHGRPAEREGRAARDDAGRYSVTGCIYSGIYGG